MADLASTTAFLALLADPTRVRLLALLGAHELSVAELTRITAVPQSRVSTHLGKLKDAELIRDRRHGASTFYRLDEARMPSAARAAWQAVAEQIDDGMLEDDRRRCADVLRARHEAASWPDAVAGRMEHHYSPGRTWEATARAFVGLVQLGDVLDVGSGDGVIAQLLAPRARRFTCLDRSEKVVDAARDRLAHLPNIELVHGDMQAMPLADASFDQVLLFSVLTYADEPERVLGEAFRVLRPGGTLVLVTLDEHNHAEISSQYEHVNAGFSPAALRRMLEQSGFAIGSCEVTAREKRKPYFDVVCAFAHRPAEADARRVPGSPKKPRPAPVHHRAP